MFLDSFKSLHQKIYTHNLNSSRLTLRLLENTLVTCNASQMTMIYILDDNSIRLKRKRSAAADSRFPAVIESTLRADVSLISCYHLLCSLEQLHRIKKRFFKKKYLEKNEHGPWNLLEPRKGCQAGASVEREEEESSSAFTMSPFCMVKMGWVGGGVEEAGGRRCCHDGAASRPLRRGRPERP